MIVAGDTIAAIATPPGNGGVGIIRISGPIVADIARQIGTILPKPRYASFCQFRDRDGDAIDSGLMLYFPAPASFTGEDILELQGHGGNVVLDMLLRRVLALGARLAEPGEFSRRAFLNNKIDLTQAEAIADLISSGTEQAARSAQQSMQGVFSRQINELIDELIELRVFVEAAIDFVDEEIDFLGDGVVAQRLAVLEERITAIGRTAQQGRLLHDGMTVVLVGKPNAGKSSLLNALARRDVAIVSPEPGTTRDVVEAHLDLGGYAVIVTDTAGLREATGAIEREGIRRTVERASQAGLVIWLVDATAPIWSPPAGLAPDPARMLVVFNKADLGVRPPAPASAFDLSAQVGGLTPLALTPSSPPPLSISALTGSGLPALIDRLAAEVAARLHDADGSALPTQARHRVALTDCRAALARFLAPNRPEPELAAEDLRLAADALGRITGRVDAEHVLGLIFGRFCIGK